MNFDDIVKNRYSVRKYEDKIIPIALLPFGYIALNHQPSQWHDDRRPMNEFAQEIE